MFKYRFILFSLRVFFVLGVSAMAAPQASASTLLVGSFQLSLSLSDANNSPPIVVDLTSPGSGAWLFENLEIGRGDLGTEPSFVDTFADSISPLSAALSWEVGDRVIYSLFFPGSQPIGGLVFNQLYYVTGPVGIVPVPAAVWLFGTALIGLVGFSKRRKAA
jgi:hypothetical protein